VGSASIRSSAPSSEIALSFLVTGSPPAGAERGSAIRPPVSHTKRRASPCASPPLRLSPEVWAGEPQRGDLTKPRPKVRRSRRRTEDLGQQNRDQPPSPEGAEQSMHYVRSLNPGRWPGLCCFAPLGLNQQPCRAESTALWGSINGPPWMSLESTVPWRLKHRQVSPQRASTCTVCRLVIYLAGDQLPVDRPLGDWRGAFRMPINGLHADVARRGPGRVVGNSEVAEKSLESHPEYLARLRRWGIQ
jgi:hypothetical protein